MTVSAGGGELSATPSLLDSLNKITGDLEEVLAEIRREVVKNPDFADPTLRQMISDRLVSISIISTDTEEEYLSDRGYSNTPKEVKPAQEEKPAPKNSPNGDTSQTKPSVPLHLVTETHVPKEVQIARESKKDQRPVSPKMRALAGKAIDEVLAYGKKDPSMGYLLKVVFGDLKLGRPVFREFKRALDLDGRIMQVDGSKYVLTVPELDVVKRGLLQTLVDVDRERIKLAVNAVVEKTPAGLSVPGNKLLGFVKRAGLMLSYDEVGEFFAAISSDPRVIAEEDGGFTVKVRVEGHGVSYPEIDTEEEQHIFSNAEMQIIGMATSGRHYRVYRMTKRMFNTLTRAPRLVHPAKLYEARTRQRLRLYRQRSP